MGDADRLHDAVARDALLLTPEEAAKLLRVGRTTVYALMKAGDLRPVHIGRSCRISHAELERYVRRLEAPAPVPSRRRAGKRTPANQGDLFETCSNPVDEAPGVDFHRLTSHRAPTLDAIDEHRQGGRDDELRGTADVAKSSRKR